MLVIASDGVWEYLENDEVMKAILPSFLKEDLQISAETLLKKSIDTWTKMNYARDDITFIIVKLGLPEKWYTICSFNITMSTWSKFVQFIHPVAE